MNYFRNAVKNPQTMIRIGLLFLVLASFARMFLHPGPHFSRGMVDGILGFLYGISIGLLILGLRKRQQCGTGASQSV